MEKEEILIDDDVEKEEIDVDGQMFFSLSLASQAFEANRNETSELYRSMMISWRNECGAPEILPYWPGADEVKTILEDEDVVANEDVGCTLPFDADVLFKCERDRLRYTLIEYLRTRLLKIEAFAAHILDNEERRSRLSSSELTFAEKFLQIQKELTAGTVGDSLEGLPEALVEADKLRAQPTPYLPKNIFAQFRRTVENVELEPELEPIVIEAGDLYVLPYQTVRDYIASGDAVIV